MRNKHFKFHKVVYRHYSGEVETFNHFVANLFRKRYTKFHQNCQSFIGDNAKNILVSFFLDTV